MIHTGRTDAEGATQVVPVHSCHLQFTRDGRALVVAERDRVVLVELANGDARRELAVEGACTIAAFTDQLWIATAAGELQRWSLDGRKLDSATIAPEHEREGTLVPTTVGGPAALWTGTRPTILLDDLGRLASVPSEARAIPIAGRRFARVAGSKLTLPAGTTVTLDGVERILGGCAILDGVSLALIAKQAGGRIARVVATASGRALQTVDLPSGDVRIAARRGVAAVRRGRDALLVDVRVGRELGTVAAGFDVADFAIDPDATQVAFRAPSGEIEVRSLQARATCPRPVVELAAVPAAEPAPHLCVEPVIEVHGEVRQPTERMMNLADAVACFAPRQPRATVAPVAARAALERELRSVALWTARAIAGAWNTRRLGYGDESTHPYEHEVGAILGRTTGFATAPVDRADHDIAEHEAAIASDPSHRAGGAVAELVREFGLSPTAVDVLLAIAAPSLDGDIARLYGILANDSSRALVDELLVLRILERTDRHAIAFELRADAPLLRAGLVRSKDFEARPFTSLEVDPVILARLRGETPHFDRAVQIRNAERDVLELDLAPGVLESAIETLRRVEQPVRIAVRGPAGIGRRALLAALAAPAHRVLGVIDASMLPRDRFSDALRTALRQVHLAGLFPVVHRLEEVVLGEQGGRDLGRDELAAHPGGLAVVAPQGVCPPLSDGHALIDLCMISETQRLDVWQRALARSGRWTRDPAGLAARHRIGPGTIHRALAAAGTDTTAPCDDAIDAYLRRARTRKLGEHARRVERLASWSDLVLPPDVMDSLRELVGRVRHRRTVFEQWGMGRKMSTSRGITALFQGQPGTGKTLVAGVVARELGIDLYQIDLSKVMSKWIGETERNLAKIFDAADDGQAILLFDEADSLFARRTEVRSSNDRYANLEVNYLLQRIDSFDGIAILTTNSGGSIDPAFKRRLSFQLSFPFPDEETRAVLWRAHIPPELPRAHELTFEPLARKYQLSGGYIRNACLRAAFLAAQEEKPLHQTHLERAVALEFAEQGKLSTTGSIS